jgi:hypothetical protein
MAQMKTLILGLILLCATQVEAQRVTVQGTVDCGIWLDGRKANAARALEHFAAGLVNGISIGSGVEIWNAQGISTSFSQLYYWIDSYCTRNPLKDVTQAVVAFADERTKGEWNKPLKK